MKKSSALIASIALLAAVGLSGCSAAASADNGFGECKLYGDEGKYKLETITPDTLLVKADVPTVGGWFNGDTVETTNSGAELCFLANIAYRGGLKKLDLQKINFAAITAGKAGSYDMISSTVTITDERKKVVDFSDPYYNSTIGVLAKKDGDVTAENLRTKKIGVEQGTTAIEYAKAWNPTQEVSVFPNISALQAAVTSGTIDVAVHDLSLTMSAAKASNGALDTVGQIPSEQNYGVVFPKGSKNVGTVNKIIHDMLADGSLKEIQAQYLTAALGENPDEIPTWNIK